MNNNSPLNNKFIDLDECIEPGEKYSNWISIAKTKLREREMLLLSQRTKICNKIIISSINHFSTCNDKTFSRHEKVYTHIEIDRMTSDNLRIYNEQICNKITNTKSSIMCKCESEIINYLSKWNGIQRATDPFDTFPQYFKQSKKWWDQRKIGLLANHFWLQMFSIILKYTKQAAAEFFCNRFFDLQHKYSRYLNIVIINNICEGTMKMGNSPDRLIIPAGSYKTFSKSDKQNIFNNNYINNTNNKYLGNKFIRSQILEEIIQKHQIYKNDFQCALLELHYEVISYSQTNQPQQQFIPMPIPIPQISNDNSNNSNRSCNSSTNMSITSNSPSNIIIPQTPPTPQPIHTLPIHTSNSRVHFNNNATNNNFHNFNNNFNDFNNNSFNNFNTNSCNNSNNNYNGYHNSHKQMQDFRFTPY